MRADKYWIIGLFLALFMLIVGAVSVLALEECQDIVPVNSECSIVTPVISCTTYDYDLYNNTFGLNLSGGEMSEIAAGSGVYNFTFDTKNQSALGIWTVILCSNHTLTLTVGEPTKVNISEEHDLTRTRIGDNATDIILNITANITAEHDKTRINISGEGDETRTWISSVNYTLLTNLSTINLSIIDHIRTNVSGEHSLTRINITGENARVYNYIVNTVYDYLVNTIYSWLTTDANIVSDSELTTARDNIKVNITGEHDKTRTNITTEHNKTRSEVSGNVLEVAGEVWDNTIRDESAGDKLDMIGNNTEPGGY
jgi:hypothetical protein